MVILFGYPIFVLTLRDENMRGKLLRVPTETYDKLKVISSKHNTSMSELLQRAVIDMSLEELKQETVPSDAELLTLMATIFERRGNTIIESQGLRDLLDKDS